MIDPQWRLTSRHKLSHVGSLDDLEQLIEEIREYKQAAFDTQRDRIGVFLRARDFPDKVVKRYQEVGGVVWLTEETMSWYMDFLSHARQLAYADIGSQWKNTQAYKLLDHHSRKLLGIRNSAYSKRNFLLRVYVHLREASSKNFECAALTRHLWKRFSELEQGLNRNPDVTGGGAGRGNGGGGGGGIQPLRCSHCRNRAVHEKYNLPLMKEKCPFHAVSQSKARKAAAKAGALLRENGNLTKDDLVVQCLAAIGD
jgi:hypothetical protein